MYLRSWLGSGDIAPAPTAYKRPGGRNGRVLMSEGMRPCASEETERARQHIGDG